jgi:hypothetical protein
MALPQRSRSVLATVVGWVLVGIVAWLLLRTVFGALGFVVRGVLVIAVIVGLLWAYLALKAPDQD